MGTLQYSLVTKTPKLGKYANQQVLTAQAVNHGTIKFEDFCRELADGSTVDQADVEAVLRRMATVIPRLVERGFSVDAGAIGTFRAAFGSKHVLTEEEFKTEHISRPRVVFTPRVAFKNSLRSVSFERVAHVPKKKKKGNAPKTVTIGGGSGDGSGSGTGIRPGHSL